MKSRRTWVLQPEVQYIWCLYKKVIVRKAKAIQSKPKYSHTEKKEYKQLGINTSWELFWTLENFSNQNLKKKKANKKLTTTKPQHFYKDAYNAYKKKKKNL